jgi:type I restriction enzyme M protein
VAIVQKLWNYCNVLRDDGMSYGDYVEQLTYLLFLKMADERSRPPYHQPSPVPEPYAWSSLVKKDGDELFDTTATPSKRNVGRSEIPTRTGAVAI